MLSVKDLVDHGIVHISDLYNGPQHKSTKQIMTLYQLPNNKLLSCLRITHFLKSHPSPKIKILPKVWQFYLTPKQNLKGISLFYNLICYKLAFKKTTAMGKWETDLGITFSDEQWQHTVRETHKASHCVKHQEMMIKMANGWHYTPYRIASYFPETSPQCWRDCRQIGNLLHMFWQCPNIKKPMEPNIFQLISSLTGILTPPDPALAILHLGIEKFPPNFKPVVTHILLETRILILRNWKNNTSINLNQMVRDRSTETIRSSVSLQYICQTLVYMAKQVTTSKASLTC